MVETMKEQFERFYKEAGTLYDSLNLFRTWLNSNAVNYEMFLEDNWFDNKTTIEYTLRCLETLNIVVIAEDEYLNSRDEKGVWHLGKYIETRWTVDDPWQTVAEFVQKNPDPRFKQDAEKIH